LDIQSRKRKFTRRNKTDTEELTYSSKENLEFIEDCKGENEEYVKWYGEMVDNLEKGELPYAFADYFSDRLLKTSKAMK
jgi:hypothetical protein